VEKQNHPTTAFEEWDDSVTTGGTEAGPNERSTAGSGSTSKAARSSGEVKEALGTAAEKVKAEAGDMAHRVKEVTGELAAEVEESAREVAGETRRKVEETAMDRKAVAAERLEGVASALRETGERLHEREEESFAQYVEVAADQVERFSGYLKNASVGDLWQDAENVARRQPELFLAGALAAGFLVGRFLKSSGARANMERTGNRYASRQYYRQPSSQYYRPPLAPSRLTQEPQYGSAFRPAGEPPGGSEYQAERPYPPAGAYTTSQEG
jgi:hypothetical protein